MFLKYLLMKSRYQRLRDRGLLTVHEVADRLAVSVDTVYEWRKHGFLRGHVHNDRPQNPPHLGELIRESMDDVGWNVTETAACLGCERGTLSRLLNGEAGVSPNMALALEDIGWGTTEHWMRMQASYELAQAPPDRAAAERRVGELYE